jgi:replicative DNA helicase
VSVAELHPSAPDFERTPPQDLNAEQSVLGGMLMSKDAIADVVEVIRSQDFYRPAHQTIFDTILDLYGRGEPADAVTIAADLTGRGEIARVGGAPYLHTLISSVPTAANAGYYARIVRDRAILRRLVEAGTRIVQMGYAANGAAIDDVVDRAQAEVYSVTDRRTSDDYLPLAEIMEGALDEIDAIASHGGRMVGVPTGFTDLDQLTNGLHPGQMVILAARPAIGKALALDTPLPTPLGWTTMGEVKAGDQLLGADGKPTRVSAATEVMLGRPCFAVEFSDGQLIVADAEHQWRIAGPAMVTPAVITTKQLARDPGIRRLPDDVRGRCIVDAQPVSSVPVRCVEVDAADHLYLAGRGQVPTHNSTLGLDLARSASIKHSLTSVIFSLEMSRNEITMRLLSAEARVALHHMRSGTMTDDDWARLARRMGEVSSAPLFIDDSPNMSMMEIRAKCRRLRQRHDLRLVIVDYMQLMQSPRRVESRQQEVSEMSRGLKLLAKELEVPVVAISQLNRGPEQRTDKKPMLADLRESGCLTEDTTLLRADTGAPITFRALLDHGHEGVLVWSFDERRRLVPAPVTHVFASGVKQVYRLRLASGREVKATGNHPFLAPAGWVALDTLEVGDLVAIPGRVPEPINARLGWPEHRFERLAQDLRSGEARFPAALHSASNAEVALFLQHMVGAAGPSGCPVSSRAEADGLALLMSRMGLVANIKEATAADGTTTYHVTSATSADFRATADDDVCWDRVAACDLIGPQPVYDATVKGTHNFIADGIAAHNSLEQDADVVILLHREDAYERESPRAGEADFIVAKHRNGPTATVTVAFQGHYSRFVDMAQT